MFVLLEGGKKEEVIFKMWAKKAKYSFALPRNQEIMQKTRDIIKRLFKDVEVKLKDQLKESMMFASDKQQGVCWGVRGDNSLHFFLIANLVEL